MVISVLHFPQIIIIPNESIHKGHFLRGASTAVEKMGCFWPNSPKADQAYKSNGTRIAFLIPKEVRDSLCLAEALQTWPSFLPGS